MWAWIILGVLFFALCAIGVKTDINGGYDMK